MVYANINAKRSEPDSARYMTALLHLPSYERQ